MDIDMARRIDKTIAKIEVLEKALEVSTSMMEAMMVQMHSWNIETVVNARGQILHNRKLLDE